MDSELMAAMYHIDDADPTDAMIPPQDMRSRRIRVGIVEYEVPTVEYVRHLERLILRQANLLEQQRRMLERLAGGMHGTRNFVRRQAGGLADLRGDLTRREYA